MRVKLSGPQFAQLAEREKESQKLLDQINETLDRFQNLDSKKPKLSKKLRWSKTDADDLRSQITAHVSVLQSFYSSLAQCAVLDALAWVKMSMQAGKIQSPSVTTLSQASNHDHDVEDTGWLEITRDLESLGITAKMAKTHKDMILRYFEVAIASGELPYREDCDSLYPALVRDNSDLVVQVSTWIDANDPSKSTGIGDADPRNSSIDSNDTTPRSRSVGSRPLGSIAGWFAGTSAGRMLKPEVPLPVLGVDNTAKAYTCVFCKQSFNERITCRQHLSDYHVAPKIFQCGKCDAKMDDQQEAEAHNNACGQGAYGYLVVKAEDKLAYACEFTGHCFGSVQPYMTFLLALCKSPGDQPPPNLPRKLRALLSHLQLRAEIERMCKILFGETFDWRTLDWPETYLLDTIEQLEHARIREGKVVFPKGKSWTEISTREYMTSLLMASPQYSRRQHDIDATQGSAPVVEQDIQRESAAATA